MVQVLLHYSMKLVLKSLNIRELESLCERTENPRVGGSIPSLATLNPNGNIGGFLF